MDMEEPRFYKKTWFYYTSWIVILGGIYLWHIQATGGFRENRLKLLIDIVLVIVGLILWLAFFSQFVLPVRTLSDRRKAFGRTWAYLFHQHGPTIFIENGHIRERQGELEKRGPGVLWLDSASAAVTRTTASFRQTIGPGVHFTQYNETIASPVDLHPQEQTLGPRESEDPFSQKAENQSADEFAQIQKRRLEVSALTRDGIEVIPNVRVEFKIDATPAQGDEPGSRFGFDPEAVRRAVTGEGINPTAPGDAPRRKVAWNQLPALVAVDLWREYLSKFKLAQLFEASQPIPPEPEPAPAAAPEATRALFQPLIPSSGLEKFLARLLHEVNATLTYLADNCENVAHKQAFTHTSRFDEFLQPADQGAAQAETALQIINRMVMARMSQPEVPYLDDSGQLGNGMMPSPEYELLKSRGIAVRAVSVQNLRFPPNIEEQLVRTWKASWLDNAKAEHKRIEQLGDAMRVEGQAEAFEAYMLSLAGHLQKHPPAARDPRDCLRNLLGRTRDELVKNDRFHRRAGLELEALEEIIQWLERIDV